VRRLRPDAAFGADLIAGFPTETEAMFENTRALIGDAGFSALHVFPFSPRKGTPAARMPQVERKTVKTRAAKLRAAGEQALSSRLASLVGSRQMLLMERGGIGRTPCFAPARFETAAPPGSIVEARIAGVAGDHLIAQIP
jgi:threonylcarbamoyladenosine tRNA methylthiotransferase MtaB